MEISNKRQRLKHSRRWWYIYLLLLFPGYGQAQQLPEATTGGRDSTRTLFSEVIYFSPGAGDWIERSEYKKAGRLLRWALSDTTTLIIITGWTDTTGTRAFNDQLSLRRARTVRNYLVSKGIAAGRVHVEGRGVDTGAASADKARRADTRAVVLVALEPVPPKKEIMPVEEQQTRTPVEKETRQPEKTNHKKKQ